MVVKVVQKITSLLWLILIIDTYCMENQPLIGNKLKNAVENCDVYSISAWRKAIEDAPTDMQKLYMEQINLHTLREINEQQISVYNKATSKIACYALGIKAVSEIIAGCGYGINAMLQENGKPYAFTALALWGMAVVDASIFFNIKCPKPIQIAGELDRFNLIKQNLVENNNFSQDPEKFSLEEITSL